MFQDQGRERAKKSADCHVTSLQSLNFKNNFMAWWWACWGSWVSSSLSSPWTTVHKQAVRVVVWDALPFWTPRYRTKQVTSYIYIYERVWLLNCDCNEGITMSCSSIISQKAKNKREPRYKGRVSICIMLTPVTGRAWWSRSIPSAGMAVALGAQGPPDPALPHNWLKLSKSKNKKEPRCKGREEPNGEKPTYEVLKSELKNTVIQDYWIVEAEVNKCFSKNAKAKV